MQFKQSLKFNYCSTHNALQYINYYNAKQTVNSKTKQKQKTKGNKTILVL